MYKNWKYRDQNESNLKIHGPKINQYFKPQTTIFVLWRENDHLD